jgi:hypothetical protein
MLGRDRPLSDNRTEYSGGHARLRATRFGRLSPPYTTIRALIKMARDEALFDLGERGRLAGAGVHRVRPARVEVAAGRRPQQRTVNVDEPLFFETY